MLFLVCTENVTPCPAASVSSVSISDVVDFSLLGITAPEILYVFSWGFAAILMGFFMGYGVQLALMLIRKI